MFVDLPRKRRDPIKQTKLAKGTGRIPKKEYAGTALRKFRTCFYDVESYSPQLQCSGHGQTCYTRSYNKHAHLSFLLVILQVWPAGVDFHRLGIG